MNFRQTFFSLTRKHHIDLNGSALHSSKLSASFGGYADILGDIVFVLGLGKGRKSSEIVEISACLTLPK